MTGSAALASAMSGGIAALAAAAVLLGVLRRDRPRAWLGLGLSALTAIAGLAGSVFSLRAAFTDVAAADPAEKASRLATGIAEAIVPAEIGWGGAFIVLSLALIGLWGTRDADR